MRRFKSQFLERKSQHEGENPQMWSPLVVPLKVCRVVCSSPRGPRLHWSDPHFGQEGVMLALGMMGWVAERRCSSLQPQATEDQARGHTNRGVGTAAAISSGPSLFSPFADVHSV